MLLAVLTGRLENAQVAVAAISICTSLSVWEIMLFFGFNAAISVQISNELGAGRPRVTKFSILVVVTTSTFIALVFLVLVLAPRNVYPLPFTNSRVVVESVSKLTTDFSFILLLKGVAVGAGWQSLVAYVNIGCYYVVGLPLGLFISFKFGMELMGIWIGMVFRVTLQTLILIGITVNTNWTKEASLADSRIKKWGGSVDTIPQVKNFETPSIPPDISNFLPTGYAMISLIDENEQVYTVKYLGENDRRISAGWAHFSKEHKLVNGDALVFHLVKPTAFKVYIVRAYGMTDIDGIQSHLNVCTLQKKTDSGAFLPYPLVLIVLSFMFAVIK